MMVYETSVSDTPKSSLIPGSLLAIKAKIVTSFKSTPEKIYGMITGRKKFSHGSISRDFVKVYARIRPLKEIEQGKSRIFELSSDHTLRVNFSELANSRSLQATEEYRFDSAFDSDSEQASIFNTVALPLIKDLFQGVNSLVFAYGITNSGKTYTMEGTFDEPGIVPRTLNCIFKNICNSYSHLNIKPSKYASVEYCEDHSQGKVTDHFDQSPHIDATTDVLAEEDYEYALWMSYFEVYNERIYDLLDNIDIGQTHDKRPHLPIKQADQYSRHVYIPGLTHLKIHSKQEAVSYLLEARSKRQVYSTSANVQSSRSHGVLTLKLVRIRKNFKDLSDAVVSSLSIVDLAGAERNREANIIDTARLRESCQINSSLMTLGKCMEAMRKNAQVIPFRESKLTEVFQNIFVGEGKASMIVTVNPDPLCFDETLHSLRFSAITKDVSSAASMTPYRTPSRSSLSVYSRLSSKKQSLTTDYDSENIFKENQELRNKVDLLEKNIEKLVLDYESRISHMIDERNMLTAKFHKDLEEKCNEIKRNEHLAFTVERESLVTEYECRINLLQLLNTIKKEPGSPKEDTFRDAPESFCETSCDNNSNSDDISNNEPLSNDELAVKPFIESLKASIESPHSPICCQYITDDSDSDAVMRTPEIANKSPSPDMSENYYDEKQVEEPAQPISAKPFLAEVDVNKPSTPLVAAEIMQSNFSRFHKSLVQKQNKITRSPVTSNHLLRFSAQKDSVSRKTLRPTSLFELHNHETPPTSLTKMRKLRSSKTNFENMEDEEDCGLEREGDPASDLQYSIIRKGLASSKTPSGARKHLSEKTSKSLEDQITKASSLLEFIR